MNWGRAVNKKYHMALPLFKGFSSFNENYHFLWLMENARGLIMLTDYFCKLTGVMVTVANFLLL
jgi:hypothetical protein